MSNKLLLSILCVSSSLFSMIGLDKKSFKAPSHLRNINVFHKEDQIFVQEGDRNPVLVNMLGDTLKKGTALKIKEVKKGKSYLSVDEINGQYRVVLKEKLKGSGPILAWIGYSVTKGALYTLGIVGLGAGISATGGVIGVAGGTALGLATGGVSVGVSAAASGLASAGAMGAGVTTGAVLGTGATIAATGGSFALITGGIEAASLAVGGLLGMIPFL